jgi:hypothetical protein
MEGSKKKSEIGRVAGCPKENRCLLYSSQVETWAADEPT